MSRGVQSITPHVRHLDAPSDLRRLQGWITWRYEQFEGEPKPRKVPYYASGQKRYGQQGSPEDRAKLVTFDAAKDAAARRGFDGVGLAMLADWDVTALDFDDCIGADGSLPPEIAAIVADTYSEYSPSGHGVRAFVKGQLGNRKDLKNPAYPWNFEVFSSSGYVTFTGNPLPTTEALGLEDVVTPAGPRVLTLCEQRFGSARGDTFTSADPFETHEPPLGLSVTEMEAYLSDLDPSMGRDDWIKVGMALHHETEGDDTGFALWDEWSSDGVQYPGTEALQAQWESFERREINRRPVTMGSVKVMSAKARSTQGLEPRIPESLQRAVEEGRERLKARDPTLTVGTPETFNGKFSIVPAGQFSQRDPPTWIIKGVLPDADLGVIYGASGSGKSFEILDMCVAIARGVEWRGRRVRQGRVLVVVAEGGGGMAGRLMAYALRHEFDFADVPLGIMHAAPNFMNDDDITEVIAALVAAQGVDLIVIDTFAQVTPGANENSGEDMGKALRNARLLREMTGAMIVLVHHSGKDATKGARGWSGIKAAADVELEVIRLEDTATRLLRTSKQKDGRDDLRWGFDLEEVLLGFDVDGDDVTSLAVVEAEVPTWEEPVSEAELVSPIERAVIDALRDSEFGDGRGGLVLDDLTSQVAERLGELDAGQDVMLTVQQMIREGAVCLQDGKVIAA